MLDERRSQKVPERRVRRAAPSATAPVAARRLASLACSFALVACGGAPGPRASGSAAPAPAQIERPAPRPAETLDVLAYNVWMLPPIARDRPERAAAIAAHLRGYDVVVLSELFDEAPRRTIVEAMAAAGYHATPVLGGSQAPRCRRRFGPFEVGVDLGLDGGVVILARAPLDFVDERLFGPLCAGEDCCAAKGVQYARFRLAADRYVHVFGTHLQNQSPAVGREDPASIRARQLEVVRRFIDETVDQRTHPGPVVVAGDLNLTPPELPAALAILRAHPPGELIGPASWGEHNTYAESDAPEHLDYVLLTADHPPPVYATLETRLFRSVHPVTRGSGLLGLQGAPVLADLSDHHPVVGHFEWGRPVADHTLRVGPCPPVGGVPLCSEPPQALWSPGSGLLCGEHVEGVFCLGGLDAPPCDNPIPKRCVQLAGPDATRPEAYDDFLCYRRAASPRPRPCRASLGSR